MKAILKCDIYEAQQDCNVVFGEPFTRKEIDDIFVLIFPKNSEFLSSVWQEGVCWIPVNDNQNRHFFRYKGGLDEAIISNLNISER